MASSSLACSIDDCKRAAKCLCHHCNKNVCSRHFTEHQLQINNELVPLTDRLNELKMRLKTEENRRGPLAMLKTWRDEKYREIDQEYDLKVQEFNTKILEQEEKVSQTIAKIEDAINDGEASLGQIKQLQKDIEMMENEVNKLMAAEQGQISSGNNSAEWDLVNTYVQLGHHKYLVKGRVFCRNENFYALECERSLTLYDGLCPKCRSAHVPLHPNRGYYAPCQSIDEQVKKQREKLT